MKKLFTLALALLGFAGVASAATADDIAFCKHSYVLKFEDYINGGKPGKGNLFGDGYFLDVTGGSIGTKGSVDLADETFCDGKYLKYAEYGKNSTTWRLKKGQDVIAMKVTAGSKIIILGEKHKSRGPQITDAAPSGNNMQGNVLGTSANTEATGGAFEWVADDDRLIYIGSDGGDYYVSYLIVEANEAEGTPMVKVGAQAYDDETGLWYRDVVCTPVEASGLPTIVTYTTDGTAPTAASPVYTAPIRVHKDATIKFQAYMDLGLGGADEAGFLNGADNEGNVSFSFDAPTIEVEGAYIRVESKYNAYDGVHNYVAVDGNIENAEEMNEATLTESATVLAYTLIENGDYATFQTKSTTKDVYVLSPIKEKKTIKITAGTTEVDEEATAANQDGLTIYKAVGVENSAEKEFFFVKTIEYAVVKEADFQVDGQEIYIKMTDNTNISFQLAANDSVDVVVTCSKNSCKMLNLDNPESSTTDRKCYVNVSGTTYGNDDVTEENGNIIKFGLKAKEGDKIFTFQKYSGTGNIMVSSIEIIPAKDEDDPTGINTINAEANGNAASFNLAGQKVSEAYKGIIVKNGKKVMMK
ncbi:MAG: chitobiase/beta-hexosaminidase C-terminal domain-containing protein [Prevotella sp.]|nr:chitobiase/beta-hexosaminidase C-terminal domain-containing protein [Prevotella sp.]